MPASDDDTHAATLIDAGLAAVSTELAAGHIDPNRAWSAVSRRDITPAVTIPDDDASPLEAANQAWRQLAEQHALFDPDGSFLISVAGPGATTRPWVRVRITDHPTLAQVLGIYPDEPEFVTAAPDGHALIGVTTEEYGIWLVYVDGTTLGSQTHKPPT